MVVPSSASGEGGGGPTAAGDACYVATCTAGVRLAQPQRFPRHVTDFRSDVAGNCRNDKAWSLIQQFDELMSMGVVG